MRFHLRWGRFGRGATTRSPSHQDAFPRPDLVSPSVTPSTQTDLHDLVAINIGQRLEAMQEQLRAAADELDEGDASAELRADQGLLLAHRRAAPPDARGTHLSDACGQRQPCSHVRALAKKYLPPEPRQSADGLT